MATMEELLAGLAKPAAYPFAVDHVAVLQTHISVVFLAGDVVYKIKKPVRLGFLDFSTLEKRKHCCEEEVHLNRRLAPDVYLGVVPIVAGKDGLSFEGSGAPVEWAVKMRRLPDDATLESRLERGQVTHDELRTLANRLAKFHAQAKTSKEIASFGSFESVAKNVRENFEQTREKVGVTISDAVWQATRDLSEQALREQEGRIRDRTRRQMPRDTHGDLRLEHVYHFPEAAPPGDWVVIDCIEFNERFRYADPVADMAFLCMDLIFAGRRDLADVFARAYFEAADDADGAHLLPLYTSYRAAVRAKVEGIMHIEKEVPAEQKAVILAEARAHWLLARDALLEPRQRAALVTVCGLPGTGKSTLSETLADRGGFAWLRSDVIRKELSGAKEATDLYQAEWTKKTYHELIRRADEELFNGARVLVDANLRLGWQRALLRDLARRWHVPIRFLECRASAEAVRRRLTERRGDVSDADWAVYQHAAREWEAEPAGADWGILNADKRPEEIVTEAWQALASPGSAVPGFS